MKPLFRVTFVITGISDLLQHSPQNMMQPELSKAKVKKIPTAEEEAEAGAYRINGPKSQLWGPAEGLRKGILTAAKGRRFGKLSAPSVLAGAVFNVTGHERCLLVDQTTKKPITTYKIDTRRVVIPSSGAAVLRSRPCISNWETELVLEIDDEIIGTEAVLEFLSMAGRSVGWLENRPERRGFHGRYEVRLKEDKKK